MEKIAIIGAGGFAREVLWLLRDCIAAGLEAEPWGFVDENPETHGTVLCGLPVKGDLESLARECAEVRAVCAIGNPRSKQSVVERVASLGIEFATLIHPRIEWSPHCQTNKGVIICAGNIITTQVEIGDHVILNLDCTVGHDVKIGAYATIAPGVHISGNCVIGAGVDIGTGSNLIQGVTVGEWSILGAGATVTRDIPPYTTAVGVPAKVIKQHK